MSAQKSLRQGKKKAGNTMQQETASRHNKEHKKKRPASRNYPCHTHFSRKTTISCQGLADNLNLPVQSNHQTQHNYTDPSHFFSRCRACPTEEEAQHPIKRLYKAMYNVEGNKCFQEQLLWRLKKNVEEDSAMTKQKQCLHIHISIPQSSYQTFHTGSSFVTQTGCI